MKKIKYLIIVLLLSSTFTSAQRLLKISAEVNGHSSEVSFIYRRGNVFASAKDMAKLLNGNYYYNSKTSKVEIKFPGYYIKFTGRNQFITVLSKTSNLQKIYQMPISTMLVKGDVFIPLKYSLKYLELAYGNKINFDNRTKNIVITNKHTGNNTAYNYNKTENGNKTNHRKTVKVNSRYDIYGIDIEEKSNGTLIRIKSQKKIIGQPRSSLMNGKLTVYLTGVSVDPDSIRHVKTGGLVRKVRYKNVAGNPQFEFTLKHGYENQETFYDVDTDDILIAIHTNIYDKKTDAVEKEKKKWKFDVVVIDAGHGGKDPGAIGFGGKREKDVNLGIALKLGKLINKTLPDIKVVYTRKTDKFVELYKRGKIANENKGKLFISIHANSMGRKRKNVRGFDVYLLRPGKTKQAIDIAEEENSVIKYEDNPKQYRKLTNENFILVSMAHSQYMRYSEKFSELLVHDWEKGVAIPARGIKQAGFYVLVGASMPSVLVETGFITNPSDAKYLSGNKGQQKIAQALLKAIEQYRNYYNKSFEEKG